jgi:hypothetical protein
VTRGLETFGRGPQNRPGADASDTDGGVSPRRQAGGGKAIELPALDGHDPLGFLATLGLFRLIATRADADAALAFSPLTGRAILHSALPSIDAITDTLAEMVAATDPETSIIGVHPEFPLRKASWKNAPAGERGDQSDPMRVPREKYHALRDRVEPLGAPALAWLSVLVTDLAVDRAGRAALTPYTAPSGQQTLRTFFDKPFQAVRAEPHRIHEALTGWRRLDGFTGEYLDHRVIRDAADHPAGKSVEAGVPGATWLATQALPLTRLGGDGERVIATMWHRHGRRTIMTWPLWRQPLDLHAVQVIIDHPLLRPTPTADQLTVARAPLQPLAVFDIAAAERQPIDGRKSAGVLAPVRVPDR